MKYIHYCRKENWTLVLITGSESESKTFLQRLKDFSFPSLSSPYSGEKLPDDTLHSPFDHGYGWGEVIQDK